jgi:hypothetical protein
VYVTLKRRGRLSMKSDMKGQHPVLRRGVRKPSEARHSIEVLKERKANQSDAIRSPQMVSRSGIAGETTNKSFDPNRNISFRGDLFRKLSILDKTVG